MTTSAQFSEAPTSSMALKTKPMRASPSMTGGVETAVMVRSFGFGAGAAAGWWARMSVCPPSGPRVGRRIRVSP